MLQAEGLSNYSSLAQSTSSDSSKSTEGSEREIWPIRPDLVAARLCNNVQKAEIFLTNDAKTETVSMVIH